MKTFYRQCKLQQGNTTYVAWLPEKHCKIGHRVSIKKGEEWTEPWTVILVASGKTADPPDYRKAIRGHRKSTGDSLPKLKPKLKGKKKDK